MTTPQTTTVHPVTHDRCQGEGRLQVVRRYGGEPTGQYVLCSCDDGIEYWSIDRGLYSLGWLPAGDYGRIDAEGLAAEVADLPVEEAEQRIEAFVAAGYDVDDGAGGPAMPSVADVLAAEVA